MKFKILCLFVLLNSFIGSIEAKTKEHVKSTDAVLISKQPMIPYGEVSSVNMITTAVTIENGDVWVWGYRGGAEQGNGRKKVNKKDKPARVEYFAKYGIKIDHVAGGAYHIIALDDKGDVWGWGQNWAFHADGGVCQDKGYVDTPCRIIEGKQVIQIGAGEYTGIALTKSGEVYVWGKNTYGEGATGDRDSPVPLHQIPQQYFNGRKVVLIGTAYQGGYAINDVGEVFGWGDDQEDSFGIPQSSRHVYQVRPVQLGITTSGQRIDYICGGEGYTEYLTDDGNVYGMGRVAALGKGGDVLNGSAKTAQPVLILNNVKTLYCRWRGSTALTHDGKLYTWGNAKSGEVENVEDIVVEGDESDPNDGNNGEKDILGSKPIRRNFNGNVITKLDGGKHHLIYWTDESKGYGVGYGHLIKFNPNNSNNEIWPGRELIWVADAMREVYGSDYKIGRGK